MKKLLLFIFLTFPLLVNAESSLGVYNAKVINKKGITYKTWENGSNTTKTIPYNTDIIVTYEKYTYVDEDTNKTNTYEYIYGFYNKNSFELKLSDVTLNKDNFTCSACNNSINIYNTFTFNEIDKIKILNPNGILIKNGPADDFSNSDKIIPFDTEVKVNYIFGTGGADEDYYYWANIYYKGINGFIYLPNNAFYSTDLIFITTEKTDITFNDKVIGYIPANTIISPSYTDNSNNIFYLTYNDLTGFIKRDSLAYGSNKYSKLIINYDHLLLSSANPKSTSLLTIPANTKLEYRFSKYDNFDLNCIYTKYQNKNGWVCFDKGEKPKYVYEDNPKQTTTTTTTKLVPKNELITDNNLKYLLIGTTLLFISVIITIISKNIILKKKQEKYLETISQIEEDND